MTCSKCGGDVLPNGRCSKCGHDVNVDLEIAAFMTPHINRARIVLVAVGLLFIYAGWRDYGPIADAKRAIDASQAGDDAALSEMRSLVNAAYAFVIFVFAAGVANIVLAIIAGKKTMFAFNAAAAIFVIYTGFNVYLGGGAFIMSWVWWGTAICLGMGYTAARKAEHLRRGTPPPGPTPPPF
jgi:hypothetical protein